MKTYKYIFTLTTLVIITLFFACDVQMGLGTSVDFEPPNLIVTTIRFEDGTYIPLQSQNAGAPLYVKSACILEGEAWDNVLVERVIAEEIGPGGTIVRTWNAILGQPDGNRRRNWSVEINGLEDGERTIRITAFDRAENSGAQSMRQLTVLVDTNPPVIQRVELERGSGITANLLPLAFLQDMNPYVFDSIDYFQNEHFTVRAFVTHGFSLTNAILTFFDTEGNKVADFNMDASSTAFAPRWTITHNDMINIDPDYSSGKSFLRVAVTANAESGNTYTNQFSYLCWYPESDKPKVVIANELSVAKQMPIPFEVIDDDNLGETYAVLIALTAWEGIAGESDEEKQQTIFNNRQSYFNGNMIDTPSREKTLSVTAPEEGGEYKLVIIAADVKDDRLAVWGFKLTRIVVADDNIPVIVVESPRENTAPHLEDGERFTVRGVVTNKTALEKVVIAWVPFSFGGTTEDRIRLAEAVLIGAAEVDNHIRLWEAPLGDPVIVQIAGEDFREQTFTHEFNLFNDFKYEGVTENRPKIISIYAGGSGGFGSFRHFRVPALTRTPAIQTISPAGTDVFAVNEAIGFRLVVTSPDGLEITAAAITAPDGTVINLVKNEDRWEGSHSLGATGYYSYGVIAVDRMGNATEREINVEVAALPALLSIGTPHRDGSLFGASRVEVVGTMSGGMAGPINTLEERSVEITLFAEFNGAVTVSGHPRLMLRGFVDGVTRYAVYREGSGSATLSFVYTVQPGDVSHGITTPSLPVDLGGDRINAHLPALAAAQTIQGQRTLRVDGIAPKVTGIYIEAFPSNPDFAPLLIGGDRLLFVLTVDKPVMVLGNVSMIFEHWHTWPLSLDGVGYPALPSWTTVGIYADGMYPKMPFLENIRNDGKEVVFQNLIPHDAITNKFRVDPGACLSENDRLHITDMAGNPIILPASGIFVYGNNPIHNRNVVSEVFLNIQNLFLRITMTRNEPYLKEFKVGAYVNVSGSRQGFFYIPPVIEYTLDFVTWNRIFTPDMNTFIFTDEFAFDVEESGQPRPRYTIKPMIQEAPWSFPPHPDESYDFPNPYYITVETQGSHILAVRARDHLGAITFAHDGTPAERTAFPFTINRSCVLSAIVCDAANGTYSTGQTINFRLIFSKPVTVAANASASITLGNGQTVTVTGLTSSLNNSVDFTWIVTGAAMNPLTVTAVNLSGITETATGLQPGFGDSVRTTFNTLRTGIITN